MRFFHISLWLFGMISLAIGSDRHIVRHSSILYETKSAQDSTLHYLALGDSYTAGTSVRAPKSFPQQLAGSLEKDMKKAIVPEVIAKAGWRTDELLDSLKSGTARTSYDIVTLWIGVNNHYQKKSFKKYKKEFPILLSEAIKLANGDANRVFVVSIPDWGYTPFGEKDGRKNISKEVDKYNAYASMKANEYEANYVSIIDISRESIRDANLIAKDGLHPSGIAYRRFVERICPMMVKTFK